MTHNVEIPVYNNYPQTLRSLLLNNVLNFNILEYDKELKDLYDEVKIRFDTNPKFYQKEDYLKLIDLISAIDIVKGLQEDDFKTINGETIVGEGDIKTPDCELSVDYSFQLEGKYIFTEGDYGEKTITPLSADYNEQTETIILE